MKIVLFNGPPGSGKDRIAKDLCAYLEAQDYYVDYYKFAWAIKKPIQTMFNLSDDEYQKYFESPEKDKPQTRFFGQIPRKVLISFSETWAKVIFGNQVFGKIAGQLLSDKGEDVIVISDCGFIEELEGLWEYIGPKNCLIYRLKRDNTTYENDSRSYIMTSMVLVNRELNNNGKPHDCVEAIVKDLKEHGIIE